MPNERKNTGKKAGLLSVAETNAMLAGELADDALKEQGSPPKSAESKALPTWILTASSSLNFSSYRMR
jgi:hypothetical protein